MRNLLEKLSFEIPDALDRRKAHTWLASWFGSGFLNPAPGTWGSLAGLLCGIPVYALGGAQGLLIGVILVTTAGLWAAHEFDKETGAHDSKMIVIDEVAGQWIAMIPAALNPLLLVLSFLFFRAFDIVKPWPVSYFDQKIDGAAGVIGDDLMAGIMAAFCVMVISFVFF